VKIGIVGAGALGTVFARALSSHGPVALLYRNDEPSPLADADVVIVAVKTYDTVAALSRLRYVLRPDAAIVSLQNGLLQLAHIRAALDGRHPVLLAPTTEGATRDASGAVRRGGVGATVVGIPAGCPGTDVVDAFVRRLREAGLAAAVANPIEPHLWAKLVVNAAINPVTALAGRPNGMLLDDAEARERAFALAREAAAVAAAAGVALPYPDPTERVLAVARTTAANRSSMLQDLERGAPTEIDAINGEVVRLGAILGVPVPNNADAVARIRARKSEHDPAR
jgi:2-dehydropantoate 2-reductase